MQAVGIMIWFTQYMVNVGVINCIKELSMAHNHTNHKNRDKILINHIEYHYQLL